MKIFIPVTRYDFGCRDASVDQVVSIGKVAHATQRNKTLSAMGAFKPKSDVTWNGAAASQAGRQLHHHSLG
jgi:hypothetical protein